MEEMGTKDIGGKERKRKECEMSYGWKIRGWGFAVDNDEENEEEEKEKTKALGGCLWREEGWGSMNLGNVIDFWVSEDEFLDFLGRTYEFVGWISGFLLIQGFFV